MIAVMTVMTVAVIAAVVMVVMVMLMPVGMGMVMVTIVIVAMIAVRVLVGRPFGSGGLAVPGFYARLALPASANPTHLVDLHGLYS